MQLFVSETLRKGLARNGEKRGVEERLVRIVEDGSGRGKKRQLVDYELLVRPGCQAWQDASQCCLLPSPTWRLPGQPFLPSTALPNLACNGRSQKLSPAAGRQGFRDLGPLRGNRCTIITNIELRCLHRRKNEEETIST